tara:strand:- start:325 stop:723 length:399 start_codon:yes stop_codon:yes gene_type:complete
LYTNKEIISAAAMLLSVAKADDLIEEKEIESIRLILTDFFQLESEHKTQSIINSALSKLNESIDIYGYGEELNNNWNYQDKVDFICCAFEVSYSDGELHYIEEHTIKKIATILNVNHQDLIKSKIDMKKYLS